MPIFCQKNRPFSKKQAALMTIFCQKKRPFSQKHGALMSFFSNFSWKTPCFHAHIWSKKRQFCQNYTLLWAKEVKRMPFFSLSIFHEKMNALITYIVKTTIFDGPQKVNKMLFLFRYFSKNNSSHAHILSKKRSFSKKDTMLSCPYFVQKTSIL